MSVAVPDINNNAVLDESRRRLLTSAASEISTEFETIVTIVERIFDFLTIAVVVFGIFRLMPVDLSIRPMPFQASFAAAALALIIVLMLDREGTYRRGNSLLRVRETERVLRVAVFIFVPLLTYTAVATHGIPKLPFWIVAVLVPVALTCQKELFYLGIRWLHTKGYGVEQVVIYGAGYTGKQVFSAVARSPKLGLVPIALIDDAVKKVGKRVFEFGYRHDRSACVEGGPVSAALLRELGATMMIVAIPSLDRQKFVNAVTAAAEAKVKVAFVPNHYVPLEAWVEHVDVDGLLLGYVCSSGSRPIYETVKRCTDLILALAMLTVMAPVWLIICAIIKLDSPGPTLFVQERIGKNGKPFKIYKFRTMFVDAPKYSYSPNTSADSRITRSGRFLRRTSLDELPQLLNVISGEMSLVGPRPEMPFIVDSYEPRHRHRLAVKPGITGMWQLSADRALLIHENIHYDLYYLRNRGFFMDLAILAHTAFFCMRGI